MTLQEICEKAGCTEQEIVQAIIEQSKTNQNLHYQARREAEEKQKSIQSSFKALKAENEQMQLLVDNWKLSKLIKEMDNERKETELKNRAIEFEKRLKATVETPDPNAVKPTEPETGQTPTMHIVKE